MSVQENATPTPRRRIPDQFILIAALALGAVAAGLVVAFLATQDDGGGTAVPAAFEGELVQLVVATRDIEPGEEITPAMVDLVDVPENLAVTGAATRESLVVGETARFPITAGEQVVPSRLFEAPEEKALSFQIPTGLRGFTVPVDETLTPATLLAPGDFVDVIVSIEIERFTVPGPVEVVEVEGTDLQGALTLLQNVQVISVERNYVDDGVPYDSSVRGEPNDEDDVAHVTVAVTPDQAQLLWLASQEGSITFSLRAFGDDEVTPLPPVLEPLPLDEFFLNPLQGESLDPDVIQ